MTQSIKHTDDQKLSGTASGEWKRILPRLLLFSRRMHNKYLSQIKEAPTPEDLAQETVADYLTGVRNIPSHIPLLSGLCAILASKVSHVPALNQVTQRVPVDELDDFPVPEYYTAMIEYVELRDQILSELMDDDELADLVLLLWEDPELKPRDLADMLGKPVNDVYNLYRRLRYKLKSIRHAIE